VSTQRCEALCYHDVSTRSFVVCSIALFFIVFECFLNGMAELTRFGDRSFYCSWWLSTTFAVRGCCVQSWLL
jgi:hypothetical protein